MGLLHSRRVLPGLTASVLTATALLASGSAHALNVRVLVLAAPQLSIKLLTGGQTAPALAQGALTPTQPGGAWRVGATGTGPAERLTLNGQDAGGPTLYLPPTPGSLVQIGGATYRGGVLLRVQRGGVQAINVVSVDDYVRGVAASEMPASWPSAALNAQAIIARTYVAARINPSQPYDTCAGESCQVYGGVAAEKPQTDAAVQATAGQVVAYRGKPASTFFSSDSGGFTASAAEVWGMNNLPYLPAQPDPFSAGGPRATWTLSVPLGRVQAAATQAGVRVGALRSVTVTKLSPSGRPQEITFAGASGSALLSGAAAGGFVRSLGAGSSRAMLSGLNPMTVQGYGQGHGVGLSQYGALGLARKGYDHLHILGFYYPGTVLSLLADSGRGAGGAALASAQPQLTQPQLIQPQLLPLGSAQAELAEHTPAQAASPEPALLAGTPLSWAQPTWATE